MTSQAPRWQDLLGMGLVIAATVAVGMGLGWLVDVLVGSTPVFILVGLAVGIIGAVGYTIGKFREYLKT